MTPSPIPARRAILAAALGGASVAALAACGGNSDPLNEGSADGKGGGGSVVVGSADFSESVLLAEIYAGALRAKGVDASTRTNIGAREIYLKALEAGEIQVMPEYTGALAIYYNKDFNETDPEKTYEALSSALPSGLKVLKKSAAEDVDCIVVTDETAKSKKLTTIADLKDAAGSMTLAAQPEFRTREQGVPGLEKVYGVTFSSFRPLRSGQATVQALKNGQVDAANIFSTDPAIAENNFVVLEDNKKLFGSQNVVPLVRDDVADQVTPALDAVSAALTTETLQDLLKRTDIDKTDPKKVAEEFLSEAGLA